MGKNDTSVAKSRDVILGDDVIERLREAAQQGESGWRDVAAIVDQIAGDWLEKNPGRREPRMMIYQKAGAVVGQKPVTIREYCYAERDFGGFIDEVTGMDLLFTLAQARAVRTFARKKEKALEEVCTWLLETSDDFGGQIAPPSWILAQCKETDDKEHPCLRAIRSVAQSSTTALKKSADGFKPLTDDIKTLADMAMDLLEKAEQYVNGNGKDGDK